MTDLELAEEFSGDGKAARRKDRFVLLALKAAREAMLILAWITNWADPFRVGVIVGAGIGGLTTIENELSGDEQPWPTPGQPLPGAEDDRG